MFTRQVCSANRQSVQNAMRNITGKAANPAIKPARWLPVTVSGPDHREHDDALLIRVGEACIEGRPGFDPASPT
jgi:hypothetical protein